MTKGRRFQHRYIGVSIHTPTKGVTYSNQLPDRHVRGFNPHTHEGCDLILSSWLILLACFNPHTHEGCDKSVFTSPPSSTMFQSTHPRRVWLSFGSHLYHASMFQSTHPRRVWRSPPFKAQAYKICFNPHTHEGCDQTMDNAGRYNRLFQSTHPRRVWHHIVSYK